MNLGKQAEKMKEASIKRFKPADVGDNVVVPLPDVDRGRGEFRNIRGVVTGVEGNGCYTIGTGEGTLKQQYTRNQFVPTKGHYMSTSDVGPGQVSLRQAAKGAALGSGQGYRRCHCTTGCNNCSCVKSGKLCTSKCHPTLTCANK